MKWRWAAGAAALALLAAALYVLGIGGARFNSDAAEVATLRAQLQRLQDRFEGLSRASPEKAFVSAPKAGLVIGIPTQVARDVARQIVAGHLARVRLALHGMRVSKSDDVQARVLFAQRTVGRFDLEMEILTVTATLRPRAPSVTFEAHRLGFSVPVAVADGRGRVRLKLNWSSKGIADLVCGDVEVTRELDGKLLPTEYVLAGSFDVVADAGSLLLRPRLEHPSILVRIEASDQAWRSFDDIVAERSGLCRDALEKADVKGKLAQLLARGFDVPLPPKLMRDIQLPVSVEHSLKLEDASFTLKVTPAEVVMTPQWLWYGTSVTIERASP